MVNFNEKTWKSLPVHRGDPNQNYELSVSILLLLFSNHRLADHTWGTCQTGCDPELKEMKQTSNYCETKVKFSKLKVKINPKATQ